MYAGLRSYYFYMTAQFKQNLMEFYCFKFYVISLKHFSYKLIDIGRIFVYLQKEYLKYFYIVIQLLPTLYA